MKLFPRTRDRIAEPVRRTAITSVMALVFAVFAFIMATALIRQR